MAVMVKLFPQEENEGEIVSFARVFEELPWPFPPIARDTLWVGDLSWDVEEAHFLMNGNVTVSATYSDNALPSDFAERLEREGFQPYEGSGVSAPMDTTFA